MEMEPLFNYALEQHELEALLRSSHLHSQLLSAELASFHGDHVNPPECQPTANPYASFAPSSSFHGDRISHAFNPISQSLHSQPPLCESLSPASFHADRNGAAGLPNPNFISATEGHLDRRLSPAGFYGELMPASFHGDNGDSAGRDYHGCKASKPARFHGDREGSAGLVNPNLVWETHRQMQQSPASFHGDLARDRPVPASKMMKTARDAESLRRKKISQFFSKLEVLLPPEDVIKYDRCSLIDSTIHYITSLEERVAKELKEREMCLDAMMKIDQHIVEGVVDRPRKEQPCKNKKLDEDPIGCSIVIPKKPEEYGEKEDLGARMISISVEGDENVFINVGTPHLEPLLFTSLFNVLHHHHLQIITATLTRMGKMLYFFFFAKISSSNHAYDQTSLKDAISRALKQS